jgi:hypothetical protein
MNMFSAHFFLNNIQFVDSVPTKNNILVQTSKILPVISPFYEVNPSISQHRVGDILS